MENFIAIYAFTSVQAMKKANMRMGHHIVTCKFSKPI